MMGNTEIYASILQSGSYREEHRCVVMNINVLMLDKLSLSRIPVIRITAWFEPVSISLLIIFHGASIFMVTVYRRSFPV